jgi:hypothetical protein
VVDREAEAEVHEVVVGEAEAESLALAPQNAGTVERKDTLDIIVPIPRKITHQR